MHRWNEVEPFLRRQAEADLRAGREVHPGFVAFAGDVACLCACLRPFPPGHYHQPVIELLALAMPLGADRLAVSFGARVWSLDDPIPPVTADADLRQPALVVHVAERRGEATASRSSIHPYSADEGGRQGRGGEVRWHAPTRLTDGRGWLWSALDLALRPGVVLTAGDDDLRRQAARAAAGGHQLWVAPAFAARLGAV